MRRSYSGFTLFAIKSIYFMKNNIIYGNSPYHRYFNTKSYRFIPALGSYETENTKWSWRHWNSTAPKKRWVYTFEPKNTNQKKYRSIGTSAGTIFLWDFEPRPFLTVFNSQNDLELTSRYQCILKKQKAVVSVLSAFIKDLDFYLKNIFFILEKWKSLVQIASQEFSILCVYCFLSIYCLKRYLLFTNLFFTFQKTIKFIYVFP